MDIYVYEGGFFNYAGYKSITPFFLRDVNDSFLDFIRNRGFKCTDIIYAIKFLPENSFLKLYDTPSYFWSNPGSLVRVNQDCSGLEFWEHNFLTNQDLNVFDPTNPEYGSLIDYDTLQEELSGFISLTTGGTVEGRLRTENTTPLYDNEFITLGFVNNTFVPKSGGTFTGDVRVMQNPVSDWSIINKGYLDTVLGSGGGVSITPGEGLYSDVNGIHVGGTSGVIDIFTDRINLASIVTPGVYALTTVDEYGRVISGQPTLSKQYINSVDSSSLHGVVDISNLPVDGSNPTCTELAYKDHSHNYLPLSGGVINGLINCSILPTDNNDLVNKAYVDSVTGSGGSAGAGLGDSILSIGTSNYGGTSNNAAREDHVHDHGTSLKCIHSHNVEELTNYDFWLNNTLSTVVDHYISISPIISSMVHNHDNDLILPNTITLSEIEDAVDVPKSYTLIPNTEYDMDDLRNLLHEHSNRSLLSNLTYNEGEILYGGVSLYTDWNFLKNIPDKINSITTVSGKPYWDGNPWTVNWNDIQEKCQSTPLQIDSAVDFSHVHSNFNLIQNIGINEHGYPTWQGSNWPSEDSNAYQPLYAGDSFIGCEIVPKLIGPDSVYFTFTGDNNIAYILDGGIVYLSGLNNYGQLGLGHNDPITGCIRNPFLKNIRRICFGVDHTVFLTSNGEVYTCGRNNYGQLGLGDNVDRNIPVKVQISNIVRIFSGYNHTILRDSDNKIWCCGRNIEGQLGLSTNINNNTFQEIPSFNASYVNVCGNSSLFYNEGAIYTCGENSNYQLGTGNDNNINEPTFIMDDVLDASIGISHLLIVKNNNTVYSCGSNSYGELGFGDTIDRNVLSLNTNLSDIMYCYAGYNNTCFQKTDYSSLVCGKNDKGQLFLNHTTNQLTITSLNYNIPNWFEMRSTYSVIY